MSIVDTFYLKPKDQPPSYVIVYAGGMAYGQGRDEQFLGFSRLSEERTKDLDGLFVHAMFCSEDCKWDRQTVWGHKLFRLDSEAWRDRMVPERVHSVWGPKANMGDRVIDVTKTGPEHPSVGGNWTAGWVKPRLEDYPQIGKSAIKWCLDGITQRYFALGPMSRDDAERLRREKGPSGVHVCDRAELEATFSHPNNWGWVHTDG